jgi:O-antigen biosynthesis protein
MDVSVVIVNYNVRDFLKNALLSLKRSLEGMPAEIFVVDNASDDGSVEMMHADFPEVHLIENTTNAGFAKANNQALEQCTGRYLLLLNPDTLIQEDTVRTLIRFFEKHPDAGMAGCKILNPDGTLQLPCRRSFPTPWVAFTKVSGLSALFPKSKLFAKYNLTYLDPDGTYEVDAISGSFMMLRRSVYEAIGGLDETFFMYGEDLDWCYRVQKSGWKLYYVPETKIIHYKGESTKRSSIDEVKVFYNAMRLFVHKHHTGSFVFEAIIQLGIKLRRALAAVIRAGKPFLLMGVDMAIVALMIFLARILWKGTAFQFPHYAYPWVYLLPGGIVAIMLTGAGVYGTHRLSLSRSLTGVVLGFILISSLTSLVKDFAFSRGIMVISGMLCTVLVPGWRLLLRLLGFGGISSRKTLFGRRTLVVGIETSGQEVVKKLRTRIGDGYSVVGFIDVNYQRVGTKLLDVEILGSIDNIGKIIDDYRITEVIFSTDAISYSTILSIIANNSSHSVNFRLVPTTMEVIIGKASIDQLDDLPFVDIDYNIRRLGNRFAKRCCDVVLVTLLLICVAPFVYFLRILLKGALPSAAAFFADAPGILSGRHSIVGREVPAHHENANGGIFLGKPGTTGIVQIQPNQHLTRDEKERFELYYAKNQSLLLDIEIMMKAMQRKGHRGKVT